MSSAALTVPSDVEGHPRSGTSPEAATGLGPADQQEERTADQTRYDGPPIPEDVTGGELDRSIRGQLKGLPERLALRVARHLVVAGQLVDDGPGDGVPAHAGGQGTGGSVGCGARSGG